MIVFLISMASLGLIAIPAIIMFCKCCDSEMEKLWCIIVVVVIWLLLGTALSADTHKKIQDWHNGNCECGGDWKLVAVSQNRGITNKFYVCEDCDKEIRQ